MKTLDYIFVTCFGFAAMMLSYQFVGIKVLSVILGIILIIYAFKAVSEENRGS